MANPSQNGYQSTSSTIYVDSEGNNVLFSQADLQSGKIVLTPLYGGIQAHWEYTQTWISSDYYDFAFICRRGGGSGG